MNPYLPEGMAPRCGGYTREELYAAQKSGAVLQAKCLLCDEKHDLSVDLGCCRGVIARKEGALGIADGSVRDIAVLSRVGLPVSFCVTALPDDAPAQLSRLHAQEQALDRLLKKTPGEVIPAVVTNLTDFGAFCDVGCGVAALLPIENISVSRIRSAAERFRLGQEIFAVIRAVDPQKRRIVLTHKELLGTWRQNAAAFRPGQTVSGIVRSVKSYGVFIELTPNLSGLAEPDETLCEGDAVSVYIKSIQPEKLKLKLAVLRRLPRAQTPEALSYSVTQGRLSSFLYGSADRPKCLTIF